MKGKKKSKIWRNIGSLVLAAVGIVVIPILIDKYSSKLYKFFLKKDRIDFNDLGLDIVKSKLRED